MKPALRSEQRAAKHLNNGDNDYKIAENTLFIHHALRVTRQYSHARSKFRAMRSLISIIMSVRAWPWQSVHEPNAVIAHCIICQSYITLNTNYVGVW